METQKTEKSETFLYALAIVLGAVVLLSPAACAMHEDHLIAQAIKSGADPIAVKCAYPSSMGGRDAMCVAYAARRP